MKNRILKNTATPIIGAGMMFMYQINNSSSPQSASAINSQSRLSAYRPSDYLHMHYAVQAYEDNPEKIKQGLKVGWALSTTHKAKNGYFGAAYLNEDKKHIIISHRGTEDLTDLVADLDSITRHLNVQEPSAWNDFAKKVIEQNGPEYSYSFTGHSLGGWLAQVCLWKYQDEFVKKQGNVYQEAFAVTMDEPGARETLEALQPRGSDHKIEVDKLDITNYLSYPNIVNTISGHVGTVYGLSPELKLSWLQNKTLSFSLAAHSSSTLLSYFSESSGLPVDCIRIFDWPRVLWGERLPNSNQSKGMLGYTWHMFKSYAKGNIDRSEYTNFYTYNLKEVNNQQSLSADKQFQLQHGIHYRVEAFNSQILPLRNMPRVVRTFLKDLNARDNRGKLLEDLINKSIEPKLLNLFNSYQINTDTEELVIPNNHSDMSSREFRDNVISFLSANKELYKYRIATLESSRFTKMIEEIKESNASDIFAQLKNQSQSTRKLLENLSLKQGTAKLYKFIKASLDEIEQVGEDLQSINNQIEALNISKLKLEDSTLQPKVIQQLMEKINTQEQQLKIAGQITTSLLLYMQSNVIESDKELDSLISALDHKSDTSDNVLNIKLLQNRAYNLKAKIAAVKNDRDLSAKYYKTAIELLPNDAITLSNYAALLTDIARAEKNPLLHVEAYRFYQKLSPMFSQLKAEQEVIARSGMAYGLIMLAQNIEQGLIDIKKSKLPQIQDLRSQAKSLLSRAIEINPNYLNARLFLAVLTYEEKDYQQALQAINHVLTLDAYHPTAMMRKGLILEKTGQIDEALNYLSLSKERLEAAQKGNENANWIREIEEHMARMQGSNKKGPSAKL